MAVTITKRGIIVTEWDGDTQQYVEQPVKTLVSQLRSACTIDPDVTLLDIFHAVDKDELLKFTLGEYSWCDVDAFHREAELPSTPPSDLEYIEISQYFEFSDDSNREGKFTLDVCGFGPVDEFGGRNYAVDFIPVNDLAHLPVRLNPNISIRKDMKEIATAKATYSLLEVLGEIYYEISFHGSPQSRDERSAELGKMVEEIKNGTANLVPWEM